jgi:hypothetical protein
MTLTNKTNHLAPHPTPCGTHNDPSHNIKLGDFVGMKVFKDFIDF